MTHEKEEAIERRLEALEQKMDAIMEQVQLGHHLILFAKVIGWLLAVGAAGAEVWRSLIKH